MDYPFTTDGCSGGMTAIWKFLWRKDPPWNNCCVEHDKLYWKGGSRKDREEADWALVECVSNNGYPIFAYLMWCAVRIGGNPLLPFSWRWGYGWKYSRFRGYSS
jgi:hypothetical protein